ncbi:MAG TPA: hypothetical protein VF682_20885 [Pseudomonas sp.]|jgi:hypothetical protein
MAIGDLDFYAPVRLPCGRLIFGAAAANWRVAQAGGFNNFSMEMVSMGMKMGYQKAVNDMRHAGRRK